MADTSVEEHIHDHVRRAFLSYLQTNPGTDRKGRQRRPITPGRGYIGRKERLMRNVEIVRFFSAGHTQTEIAAMFDVTPQRVNQIVNGLRI